MRSIFRHVSAISICFAMSLTSLTGLQAANDSETPERPAQTFADIVRADQPVAWWRFSETERKSVPNAAAFEAPAQAAEKQGLPRSVPGARPSEFPLFTAKNNAVNFQAGGQHFVITDPGDNSPFDFDNGDAITIEAWVAPAEYHSGGHGYIIGKGRVKSGTSNQNFALRLSAGGRISFLFRSRGEKPDWHRWTSKTGLAIGNGWHHVAVTYQFGDSKSLHGYIDGKEVKGSWDMGGATAQPPVVDNDAIWIGSSMGGNPGSTFKGALDEVALYRKALSAKQIASHFKYVVPEYTFDESLIPETGVLVELFEGLPDQKSWEFRPPKFVERYRAPAFGFIAVPRKYSEKAIQIDRTNPFLLRAVGKITLPEGEQRLLVRSRNSARVYLDGKLIAQTAFHSLGGDNGPVFEIDRSLAPNIRPLHRGDSEEVVTLMGDGKQHRVLLETIVGGGGRRPELGETGIFLAPPGEDFRLLGATHDVLLTDAGWLDYADSQRAFLTELNARHRQQVGTKEAEYWARRHDIARRRIAKLPPVQIPKVSDSTPVNNVIDKFIGHKLEESDIAPTPVVDDLAFLRRVTLDITGRIPTIGEIEQFESDPAETRRSLAIDRLLESPEWTDGWMGYWQDVLAENPNIINPTLNNTGPFRWWIEESFDDNKPFDRFATELVMMEGSKYFGGPAGFSMASQNDAPFAAKAHILGGAFLAVEMKCARCHDAPYHDLDQRDLFALAAMLKRGGQPVPVSSTVPGGASNSELIEINLKPGEVVPPEWPFAEISSSDSIDDLVRNDSDSRERLAALLTSPENTRFAEVIVNRLWQRYLGHGIVTSVEDWEYAQPSHPQLLDYLSREFISHGYDLKHLARLIFNSHVYQRTPTSEHSDLFAGPAQRRLRAEQIVDSLFVFSGKPFDADVMNIDIDTGRRLTASMNLGRPRRAWEMASLSNERDRPSLSLPYAQPFITLLETFGWRSARQDPITIRETAPNPLQPAEMENGLLARRASNISEESAFTALAIRDLPVDELVDAVYLRILGRHPRATEREIFVDLLKDGYNERIVENPQFKRVEHLPRTRVAWTNHLNPEASLVKLAQADEVRRGEPQTPRLKSDWCQRLEDMVWTLMNSPEFLFVP